MSQSSKKQAFDRLRVENPRGADIGVKIVYHDYIHAHEFTVVAEQVWETPKARRVMGLVWSGACRACGEGFMQLSPSHPPELNEYCQFCSPSRFEGFNVSDRTVFRPVVGVKRRGRLEQHVLDTIRAHFTEEVVDLEQLIRATVDRIPAPEEGVRDTRRQSVLRAIKGLSAEKNGPLQLIGGSVLLYL